MIKKFIIVSLFSALAFFSSCNIGKTLEKPAYVVLDDDSFTTLFDLMSEKYADSHESASYMYEFEQELSESLISYNIIVRHSLDEVDDPGNVFIISMNKLNIDETYEIETVNMESLSDSPNTFQVVSCGVQVECVLFEIDSNGNKYDIYRINTSASKDEKLSNNRTFWQVIFGSNKNNSEYTYKELDEDIIITLCKRTARRVAGKSSRTIEKHQP